MGVSHGWVCHEMGRIPRAVPTFGHVYRRCRGHVIWRSLSSFVFANMRKFIVSEEESHVEATDCEGKVMKRVTIRETEGALFLSTSCAFEQCSPTSENIADFTQLYTNSLWQMP